MPDVAQVAAPRKALPFTTRAGDTVTLHNGVIYLNARPINAVDALELSAALARAVTDHASDQVAANPNHTPTEGA